MDLRQFRYFVTIVQENNNITQAAKKLNISQPPLSQQLKAMEAQMNAEFFIRNGKRLELTDVGAVFYNRATKLLEMIEEIKNEIADVKDGSSGCLSLGTSDFYGPLLTDKICEFNSIYPGITYRIIQSDANRLGALLMSGEIDLAIVNMPIDLQLSEFHTHRLNQIGFSLFVPNEWEWNGSETEITFQEMENIPLVLTKREEGKGGSYDVFMKECSIAGIKPNILAECNNLQTVISLISKGLGASILPNYMNQFLISRNLRQFHIRDSELYNDSAIIWRKKNYTPKAITHFVNLFDNLSQYSF
ncbi:MULTISPECIES: LysR family transcriptional regulator [unclassified Paenibacillus]|uniref:LysR family transcriptional regulator n=1 Tax=unclassified Paenibacillus TaxID=185978 RepID=UPI00240676E1|nr:MULTISPECIES: LysR family transcriptional regulator [unclassified Paenibacillus]MDF9844769.1 DNA-binding transcriptional LysR family regulator [Paenibacillus sp. PastF-2]MDF9851371.1 DNA-binding transcriptional LysR family regulator [Paenibacillus sp. PastM-2]MDF9857953.1 DNA-binding transcriptional LysR family regulator [Paenibacillus sp. PastF-1]MDH6483221.1 DNA-binding transcriptional LysR family regulator [Paenibacillus sp. PastH-2]MDH6510631.1 DNA-binding transcriptional LysR family re